MRIFLTVLALIASCALLVPILDVVIAQESVTYRDTTQIYDVQKIMLYESLKKNPLIAVNLASILPSAGHAYAGNWGRGLLFAISEAGCVYYALTKGWKDVMGDVWIAGIDGGHWERMSIARKPTTGFWVGMFGALILEGVAIGDAALEVERYNKDLYDKINPRFHNVQTTERKLFDLSIWPVERGGELSLTYYCGN